MPRRKPSLTLDDMRLSDAEWSLMKEWLKSDDAPQLLRQRAMRESQDGIINRTRMHQKLAAMLNAEADVVLAAMRLERAREMEQSSERTLTEVQQLRRTNAELRQIVKTTAIERDTEARRKEVALGRTALATHARSSRQ